MFSKLGLKKNGLKIIIVGCGKVGMTLVEQLSKEGHDVTIIDSNAQKVSSVANFNDVMGICGNGASYTTQVEAGIKDADLFIAVTASDELNLLCCTIATQVGDCAAIARVRTPDYSHEVSYLQEKLGLAMIINPEMEAAMDMARILYLPSALEVNSFAHGQADMVKFYIPKDSMLCDRAISESASGLANKVLICGVERGNEVIIPSGDFVLKEGDLVSFVTARKKVAPFLKEIGIKTNRVKDTLIIGGGKGAYYLARHLLTLGIDVKIIEADKKRCEELSILLPEAIIINGDGIDQELLKEEGIEYVESFVPLTGIDEVNVLLTLHARSVTKANAKVITKINRINFKNVLNGLSLGSVVYPNHIASEMILAYVRARTNSKDSVSVETLTHMYDGRVEAIEFSVNEQSAVIDIPLRDLNIKQNVLVSFINHNGQIIIPSGHDMIHAGDTVMLVTTHTGFTDITDMLEETDE
ncbi:MAG: Trk system potassium transporter TrkA [Lachnospiraceae bacterium]|jgi:trk system potassium uptake protein TrkA|nr:Trk system potassium transporter TrkA [Lachnospiraceae bacterium]